MEAIDVMKGGMDLHTHTSPSVFPRKQTDWEMVEEARKYKLFGIVLKAHESDTASRAHIINLIEKDIKVFGGVVLNHFVGGLNPSAVEVSLKMGGKFIWMPTISSKQHMDHFRGKEKRLFKGLDQMNLLQTGISIVDEKGELVAPIHDILELAKKYDAVLCSGHISAEELNVLADEVKNRKIEKFLINHPDMGIAPVPMELQKKLASNGAFLEKCLLATTSEFSNVTVEKMNKTIKELGSSNCVLVTDFGQDFNITPIQAMEQYIRQLITTGFTKDEVKEMYVDNPRALVD